MFWGAIWSKPQPLKNLPLLVQQLYSVGVQSLLIIVLSGLFIGMVLSLQGYVILVDFGAEGALGQMVALSLLRELGPVVTALLFAGRAGSALTAEIGLMKATEQISSLEMMAVDPLKRIIAPRLWAGVISMPLLTMIFIAIGIWPSFNSFLPPLFLLPPPSFLPSRARREQRDRYVCLPSPYPPSSPSSSSCSSPSSFS